MANPTPQQARARYRLIAAAYIDDRLYQEGAEIEYDGIPGWHMQPLNAMARKRVEQHQPERNDPIASLTVIGQPHTP